MRKTEEKIEEERLERMFQKILNLLIILLAVMVTISGLKLIHKKSTTQSVSAPLGFIVRGENPEALVVGGFPPIPPPSEDVSSPTELGPLLFSDPSTEEEVFYQLVPVLKPKVKPKRAIRRVGEKYRLASDPLGDRFQEMDGEAVTEPENFDFRYISYGAGVQSTALLVLSCLGLRGVPKADAACFSDTGDEPASVYKYLEIMKPWAKSHGIEIYTCSKGHLSKDLIETNRNFISIPVWTKGADGRAAPLRRQCTNEYKIVPLEQWVRKRLGYIPRQRMKHKVQAMIGISLDEVSRCKPSRTKWVTNSYPLIDAHIHRPLCMEIIADAGLPPPSKSSCLFCPYHGDDFYRRLKEDHPEDFEKACLFDEEVRSKGGRYRGSVDPDPYIHRSLKPLREVDFTDNQLSLWEEECEGYCGV